MLLVQGLQMLVAPVNLDAPDAEAPPSGLNQQADTLDRGKPKPHAADIRTCEATAKFFPLVGLRTCGGSNPTLVAHWEHSLTMQYSQPNEASLIAAHDARLQALIAGDVDALARVVSEDMRFIGPDGTEITRPDVVASLQNGTLSIEKMDCYDISTRLYGDTGVLLYSAQARTSDGENVFAGRVRCTTIYIWRAEGWQMVSQHQSRLAD